ARIPDRRGATRTRLYPMPRVAAQRGLSGTRSAARNQIPRFPGATSGFTNRTLTPGNGWFSWRWADPWSWIRLWQCAIREVHVAIPIDENQIVLARPDVIVHPVPVDRTVDRGHLVA